jgi:hypothetical protein
MGDLVDRVAVRKPGEGIEELMEAGGCGLVAAERACRNQVRVAPTVPE